MSLGISFLFSFPPQFYNYMCLLYITLDFQVLKIMTIFTSIYLLILHCNPTNEQTQYAKSGGGKNQHNFYLFLTYYDSLLWVLRVKKKKKKQMLFLSFSIYRFLFCLMNAAQPCQFSHINVMLLSNQLMFSVRMCCSWTLILT